MPLRDHFHPPLSQQRRWDLLHGQWPATIVAGLARRLPPNYYAGPRVHLNRVEIDVGGFHQPWEDGPPTDGQNGTVAAAVYAPPEPTLAVETDWPETDDYEVLIHDSDLGGQLVAAIEIVSPSNKDRPEHRRAFVAKCATLLQQDVSVTVIDLVTSKNFNLYAELLAFLGQADPNAGTPPVYAVACRGGKVSGGRGLLQAWYQPLALGHPLPTLPLWLGSDLVLPLDFEASYEETCRVLRVPR